MISTKVLKFWMRYVLCTARRRKLISTTQREYRIARKKLASCSTLAWSTQRTMIVNNSFRASHSVYSSWLHRLWDDGLLTLLGRQQLPSDANIWTYVVFETRISPQMGRIWCGNRINDAYFSTMRLSFLVFEIWLWDGPRTDDGPTSVTVAYRAVNLLECRGNYNDTSNNMKLVHLVQRGGDWARPQPAKDPPRCTKCNSPPINGQCTNHRIAVYRSAALRF